jgi:hypothetical protein
MCLYRPSVCHVQYFPPFDPVVVGARTSVKAQASKQASKQ